MAVRLYISNLSPLVTSDELLQLFGRFGEIVDVDLVMDRDTGSNRGYGFVEMAMDAGAESAIRQMNGYALHDRPMNVTQAIRQSRR